VRGGERGLKKAAQPDGFLKQYRDRRAGQAFDSAIARMREKGHAQKYRHRWEPVHPVDMVFGWKGTGPPGNSRRGALTRYRDPGHASWQRAGHVPKSVIRKGCRTVQTGIRTAPERGIAPIAPGIHKVRVVAPP